MLLSSTNRSTSVTVIYYAPSHSLDQRPASLSDNKSPPATITGTTTSFNATRQGQGAEIDPIEAIRML
ncbi:hypothetical protein HDU76_002611 [Blyttiomyces sp. JEL0837]|nr:hypothetical protein HDU76_002611 [Blyttiomyces sp. JEL0837]